MGFGKLISVFVYMKVLPGYYLVTFSLSIPGKEQFYDALHLPTLLEKCGFLRCLKCVQSHDHFCTFMQLYPFMDDASLKEVHKHGSISAPPARSLLLSINIASIPQSQCTDSCDRQET